MNRKFLVDNLVSSISNILVGIVNWVFTFVLLKYSGIEVANSFLALMSFFLIITIPSTALGYILNKIGANVWELFHKKKNLVYGILISYLLIVMILSFWSGYGIKTISIIYLLIFTSLLGSYYKSLLQHNLYFLQFSSISLIEVIIKVLVLVVLMKFTDHAALISFGIQLIIGLGLSYLIYTHSTTYIVVTESIDYGILLTVIAFTASIVVYGSIDTLIGRFALSSIDLNNYQKLLQISKVLIFFCIGLNTVLIPTLERQSSEFKNFKLILYITGAEVIATIGFATLLYIFNGQIYSVFSLSTNLNIFSIILFVIAGGIYSISQTFSVLAFRQNKWKVIFSIFCMTTILQIALFYLSHDVNQYIISSLFVAILNLFLYLGFQFSHLKIFYLDYINDAKEVV